MLILPQASVSPGLQPGRAELGAEWLMNIHQGHGLNPLSPDPDDSTTSQLLLKHGSQKTLFFPLIIILTCFFPYLYNLKYWILKNLFWGQKRRPFVIFAFSKSMRFRFKWSGAGPEWGHRFKAQLVTLMSIQGGEALLLVDCWNKSCKAEAGEAQAPCRTERKTQLHRHVPQANGAKHSG